MPYDDGNFTVRREQFAGEAGGAATTEYGKFRGFQAFRLKKVHAVVTTAGTVTTHSLGIYHGTTSLSNLVLSTSTAGSGFSSVLLDRDVASFDQVSVKTTADATGKAHVIFEYEVSPASVKS